MKSIREVYKDLHVEDTVQTYSHKVLVQGRWARMQLKKQVHQVEGYLEVPQKRFRTLTDSLTHDMEALKKFYETQKREIQRVGKTLRKNGDRFLEKSKIYSAFTSGSKATKGEETTAKND